MKSSTSRPSSRNCSASVRPVRRHAQAVAGGFVHLAKHERDLVEHARVRHLVVEVVALAGALAHAGEHGKARVLDGDVADELQHGNGLADARPAEEAHLAALRHGADEVDHLDAGVRRSMPPVWSSKVGALR